MIYKLMVLNLGTAQSVGVTVDNLHPHEIVDKIRAGEVVIPEE
jgi:hypothetical protein